MAPAASTTVECPNRAAHGALANTSLHVAPAANAPWGARDRHTSVIDAAGAIYVIGGTRDGPAYYNDMWASTDGGARAGLG